MARKLNRARNQFLFKVFAAASAQSEHHLLALVWQHLYSRGKFVLKASNWSRSIKKTSNNKKNLVASFVTRTEAFQRGQQINLTDYA